MPGFGDWVRSERKRKGLTLDTLARAVTTRVDTISRIELGKQNPHPGLKQKLEEFLRLPTAPNHKSDAQIAEQWQRLLEKKKISQDAAMRQIIRFVTNQSDLAQSVILGQMPPTPGVLRLIYEEIAEAHQLRQAAMQEREERKKTE